MNSVNLTGNLASDVDVREVKVGDETRKVASFLLAVNRPGKDAGADFLRINAWNGQGESCAKYLSKGKKVAVEGRIRSSQQVLEDGSKRNHVDVTANRVEFLSPAPSNSGIQVEQNAKDAETATAAAAPGTDDDIPF